MAPNHPNRSRKPRVTPAAAAPAPATDIIENLNDPTFELLRGFVAEGSKMLCEGSPEEPIFHTAASGMWNLFYDNLSPGIRQHHNCNACRSFINRYGNLAMVDRTTGRRQSLFWNEHAVPPVYYTAVREMREVVEGAGVRGVFLTDRNRLGHPVEGATERHGHPPHLWTHLFAEVPRQAAWSSPVLTPAQRQAVVHENVRNVARTLQEFGVPVIQQASTIINQTLVNDAEKFRAPMAWLLSTAHAVDKNSSSFSSRINLDAVLWRRVAAAPDGYCHVRAGVTGELLQMVKDGQPISVIQKTLASMTKSTTYQRPQAPPKAANIDQADKLISQMGLERSLERRFATLDDCAVKLWRPVERNPRGGDGVPPGSTFGYLKNPTTAGDSPLTIEGDGTRITWEKFARTALPSIVKMDFKVPFAGAFVGLVAPVHDDAPSIFKYANKISWYTYAVPTTPQQWGISSGWCEVTAVVPLPCLWDEPPMPNLGDGAIITLRGCRDGSEPGSGLFPVLLKGELHSVRQTIEAHSQRTRLQGFEQANACGWDVRNAKSFTPFHIRARLLGDVEIVYLVDRWD